MPSPVMRALVLLALPVLSAAEAPFTEATVLDLVAVDPDLKGFHGGFQDGAHGYVVPWTNGAYFGKVARFTLHDLANVEVLDLTVVDPDLKGFAGGFHDGTFGYVVPFRNKDDGYFGKVARFKLQGFTDVEVLDLTATDPDLTGFYGGFQDGTYGYVLPHKNPAYHGKVARFPLQGFASVEVLDLTAADPDLKGFAEGFDDGTYGYLVPFNNGAYHGKVARFMLRGFSNVEVLDLTATDPDLKGFNGGFQDGTYGYLVPYWASVSSGKIVRFALQGFADVEVLDLMAADSDLKGGSGGFHDGTYGYVVPFKSDENFGKVARFRLQGFADVEVLDLAATDSDLKGFWGGFCDGTNGYVVPFRKRDQFGKVARFAVQAQTTTSLTTTPSLPTTSSGLGSNATTGECAAAGTTLEDAAQGFRKVMADARQRAVSRAGALRTSATAIAACPVDIKAESADGIPWNDTVEAREDHISCRMLEGQKRSAADVACDAVERFWYDVVVPPCAVPSGSRSFNDSLACVLVLKNWSRDTHAELIARNAACDGNTTAAAEQRRECGEAQAVFEGSFCAFSSSAVTACDRCYKERTEAHTALVKEALQNESSDKLAYTDAEISVCELGVLSEANLTRKQERRDACRDLVPDASVLDIDWPTVPEDVGCEATVVESKPCDDEWMQEEYNQTWAATAPAGECTPCPRKLGDSAALGVLESDTWRFV